MVVILGSMCGIWCAHCYCRLLQDNAVELELDQKNVLTYLIMNSSFLPPYHSRSPRVLPMSVKGENTLGFPLPSSFFNTNCSWIVFQTSMNTFSHARIWQQLSSAGGWLIDELRRHSAVTITNNVFNFQLWIFTVTVAIKLVISFFTYLKYLFSREENFIWLSVGVFPTHGCVRKCPRGSAT